MKRSTAPWTTAIAAAALIGLPSLAAAQTPASPQTQPPAQTQATTPSASADQNASSPADHVRAARQALNSIPQSSIPAADRTKFAQLRTHLSKLERDVASGGSASASASATASPKSPAGAAAGSWGTEVAAIDKIITDLIGPETGSAASSSSMTSGSAGSESSAAGAAGTSGRAPAASKSPRATTLDENAKAQLQEVRRHITELASSMSGTAKQDQSGAAAPSSPDTMGSASSQSSTSSMTSSPASPTSPTASGNPAAATQPPSGTEAAAGGQSPTSTTQAHVDAAAAKQHLSEARDSLSQIASMPEAARLQGEARTQVSQLIANFNELITTQNDWKAAYAKVDASLTSLIGPDDSSAPAAASSASSVAGTSGTTATSGTAGTSGTGTPTAAGTSGAAAQVDPAIRAKLVEFRTHLKAFEQAAGGDVATNASSAASPSAMSPSVSTGSTANPANPASSVTGSSPTAAPPAAAGTATQGQPTQPTETSAQSAKPPASPSSPQNPPPQSPTMMSTAGTSGASAAAPTATDAQRPAASEQAGHAQADKELDAIQAILDKAKDGKLDKSDTELLKQHVQLLRQLLSQSGSGK